MKMISNPLTDFLDDKLLTIDDVEEFIDNLEDEIFGIPNRDFYMIYKGDIKDLIEKSDDIFDELSFESELLASFLVYLTQRKSANRL